MKKLFLFLCAALMSVASMWAQTETLLTTITATAQEQASYSTANVATVSFSYTAGGSSAYIALWGWWGYGWSATVNAAEGYTITKCVFYDDANRTATDSEAPFVVETTEEDKTPKVNGTPIMADMSKGIKKIDVYGYENPTTVAVTGVTLNQNEAQMTVGETLTLTPTVLPGNATNKDVMWTSDNGYVATVENGVVTAVAAGNATITVTTVDGEYTATCDVTVTAPEPAGDEITVTWNDPSGSGFEFTQDGVTLTCGEISSIDFYGPGTFTTDLGNFTKIEVTAYSSSINGDGWSGSTWTGNAASVSFSNDIYALTSIVFTIEPASTPEPEPEPQPVTTYTVTFTDINSNVKVVENITLPHTFSCDYTNGNGELDQIIQEFYNEPGGHCATNGWPWGGNDNEVVVGHDGNNHFVTINAPFIGTSFMSGYYDGINDGNFYYTFHITIAASTPEPEPEPQNTNVNVEGGQDPENTTYYYSTFFDSQVKYLLPEGVEAYVAELSGDALTLTRIAVAGQTIPANNAVIFRANAENFTLTPSTADAVTFSATNSLQGVDEVADVPANCYVLSNEDGKIGFYAYNGNQLNAHKAYITYDGGSGSGAPRRMRFIFAEEQTATGAESATTNVESRKVIENGQLVIIHGGVRYNAAGQVIE